MSLFRKKKPAAPPISLHSIVNEAKEILIKHQETFHYQQQALYKELFYENGSPKTKKIKSSNGTFITVPLATLIHHQTYDIAEFDIIFEVPLSSPDIKRLKTEKTQAQKIGLYIDYSENTRLQGMVTIKMSYKTN